MRTLRILTIGVGLVLFSATLASAQATRTWVSGVGDDANPCSRTAPCKTFAGAISKTAAGGEISVLDPGGFGAVTITKAITINGVGTHASILAAGTNGIIVNVTASAGPVILKNIEINGAGTGIDGIRFLDGASLHVENVRITGFTGQGIEAPAGGAARQLFVKDTTIGNTIGGGILLSGPVRAFLDAVRVERSGANGLRANAGSEATVRNSMFAANALNGVNAVAGAPTPGIISVEGSLLTGNSVSGLRASGVGAIVRVGNSSVTDNAEGLSVNNGGAIESYGDNRVGGNTIDGVPTTTIPRI